MTDTTEGLAIAEHEAPTLEIQDIANALKVIDYAADQGAYKSWDTIEKVLSVRNKIAAFVEYAQASQAAQA
jgi:hypothetical protein